MKQPSLHMSAAAASRDITQVFECTICTIFYSFVHYSYIRNTSVSAATSPSLRIVGSGAMLVSTFKQSTLHQLTRKCAFPQEIWHAHPLRVRNLIPVPLVMCPPSNFPLDKPGYFPGENVFIIFLSVSCFVCSAQK